VVSNKVENSHQIQRERRETRNQNHLPLVVACIRTADLWPWVVALTTTTIVQGTIIGWRRAATVLAPTRGVSEALVRIVAVIGMIPNTAAENWIVLSGAANFRIGKGAFVTV